MQKEYVTSKEYPITVKSNPISHAPESGFVSKIGKHINKIIFIGSIAAIGLIFNSCAAGYVATEPAYVEYSRPQRPSELHIWVNGDWVYNRSTRVYVQRAGHWQAPTQRRTYISGSWQSAPQGKYWKRGHWQKQNSNSNDHKRRR